MSYTMKKTEIIFQKENVIIPECARINTSL
jgi:hypothetical protein